MATIKQDIYILGQSEAKRIQSIGEEIRLDLQLQPQPLNTTGTVTGTITDTTGQPIPNALVKLMDSNYEPLMHSLTGTDGTYTIDNVKPGSGYNVFAISQGKKLNQGISFALASNQVVNRDFTLEDDPSAQLGIIAGDIIDSATGRPVGGAVASLYSINSDETEVLEAITYTNEFGQFVFRELDLGNYVVRISALGYERTISTANVTKSGQIVKSAVKMVPDTTTSRGTISGIITNNNNVPIENADVVLYEVNEDESLTPISFTKTNAQGVYLFINVAQGNYKVKSNQTEDVTV